MLKQILTSSAVIAAVLVATGCDEDSTSYQTPNTTGPAANSNPVSQNNFTITANPLSPAYFDTTTNTFTAVTSTISVQVGDNDNRVVTSGKLIEFRTEWGLLENSTCTTDEDGTCTVTWRSGSIGEMPADFRNNIVAFHREGQESFGDLDGNSLYNDGDTFGTTPYSDVVEPFINVDSSTSNGEPTFTNGDRVIDVVNAEDLTGADGVWNDGDNLFNGRNCQHSTDCSTVITYVAVWESQDLFINGGNTYTVSGNVTGLDPTSELILTANGRTITITVDGSVDYLTVLENNSYQVQITTNPIGLTCTFTGEPDPTEISGTSNSDVTGKDIDCT